jgi:prepilin-type processing-associated H-X9-DG protein
MTELMVVIAIMTILSAILLPALSKGRSRSRTISCLNNLRQLQISWQLYADDHDALPANNYVNGFKLGNGFGFNTGLSWCPGNTSSDTTTTNIEQGQLFPYNKSVAIYHCPADTAEVAGVQGPMPRTRSYSMSSSVGCEVAGFPTAMRYSDIIEPDPSGLFVFIDAHEEVADAHFALYPERMNPTKLWIDIPSDRHDQAGNLSFADGHIERWKWAAPKRFQKWQQLTSGVEDHNDMRRLQSVMRQ